MKKILETERLYLREMTQEDIGDLREILQDPIAMKAYEHAFSEDEVQNWLDRQLQRYREHGFGLWAAIDKETGEFVGQVGLTMQDAGGEQVLEIGYLLKRKHWHKGYATEAAIACREYAFNTLERDRVTSIIRENNLASRAVAERLGMRVERMLIRHYYGIDMPHCLYSISRTPR